MIEIDMTNKTGFDAFREQCRYVSWKWQKVAVDCSASQDVNVPFCRQEDNLVKVKKKTYAPVCRKEICPYYRKGDKK